MAYLVAVLASLAIAFICCALVYFRAKQLDEWVTQTKTRKRVQAGLKFGFVALAAILVRVVNWRALFLMSGTTASDAAATASDAFVASFVMVLTSLSGTIELLQLRQTDKTSEKLEELEWEKENIYQELAEAKSDEFFFRWTSVCFLRAVGIKADRFQEAAQTKPKKRIDQAHSLEQLRAAAAPSTQIEALIQVLYRVYETIVEGKNNKAKLRITYLHTVGKALQVRYAWNGTDKKFIRSLPSQCKERFRLNGTPRSAAAYAAIHGEVLIIPDTQAAHDAQNHVFEFCHPAQRSYLRSLVILPIRNIDEKNPHRHVICIDTDKTGLFTEDQRAWHEFLREQIEKRLLVELGVECLLER